MSIPKTLGGGSLPARRFCGKQGLTESVGLKPELEQLKTLRNTTLDGSTDPNLTQSQHTWIDARPVSAD